MGEVIRKRRYLVPALVVTILLGMCSRSNIELNPFVRSHAGDALWAFMIYIGFAILFPHWQTLRLAILSAAFCVAIECSQLIQGNPWLDSLRANTVGALVLGQGFLWIDLIRYATGIATAVLIDSTPAIIRCPWITDKEPRQ